METLLRQKVCKSKHNFLITKQLEEKKAERKKRKDCFFRSEWFGHFWNPFSRYPHRKAVCSYRG
jgi:hypothetical protein